MNLDTEIRIRFNDISKGELEEIAKKKGLPTGTYARTILMREIEFEKKIQKNEKHS